MPDFSPLRLGPLLSALAAVPPVLSNLTLHLPLFFPGQDLCFSHWPVSLLGSWLLWSGSLDLRTFLWKQTMESKTKTQDRQSERGAVKEKTIFLTPRLQHIMSLKTVHNRITNQDTHKVNKANTKTTAKRPRGNDVLSIWNVFPSFPWPLLFLAEARPFVEATSKKNSHESAHTHLDT